jgi:2-iminobutanoate/2-iminopropanoate deaminase
MKRAINTSQAPAPIGPYNQSIAAGGMLFISGQIPIDPSTGQLIQGTIEQEASQVL